MYLSWKHWTPILHLIILFNLEIRVLTTWPFQDIQLLLCRLWNQLFSNLNRHRRLKIARWLDHWMLTVPSLCCWRCWQMSRDDVDKGSLGNFFHDPSGHWDQLCYLGVGEDEYWYRTLNVAAWRRISSWTLALGLWGTSHTSHTGKIVVCDLSWKWLRYCGWLVTRIPIIQSTWPDIVDVSCRIFMEGISTIQLKSRHGKPMGYISHL